MTDEETQTTGRRMGRPPLNMREIKVAFREETLAEVDQLVGNKHRSKFIREAVEGALKAAKLVKTPHENQE